MTTNSSKVIKSFSCRLKSTEGEETLKTEVKLKHLKKIHLKKLRIVQTYPADCRKIAAVDSNKHDWD